jgi:prepilin-type N-terminal cleavage/methylation domain-containing protein
MRLARRIGTSNQCGDTIVEVLIAVAIISMVLAASYALVNNPDACSLKADGVNGSCQDQPCYNVNITVDASGIYTVTAQWDNLRGETSKISMEYGV